MRVCASGEVVQCTPPVAFSELRLTGRENATKKISSQILWFLSITSSEWSVGVIYLQFPEARVTPSLIASQCCQSPLN